MLLDSTLVIYMIMKAFLLVSLVGALKKTDALREETLGLSVIYTVGVAFLSYVFLVGPNRETTNWLKWLGATFVVSLVYFKSLNWFEESRLFWVVVALGAAVVWF